MKSSGTQLFAWGLGACGALGTGSKENELVPKSVKCASLNPIAISAGRYFSAFITEKRQLYVFGNNGYSRAGLPASFGETIWNPTLVPSPVPIVAVACGDWHMLTLSTEGQAFATGFNKYGELGLGHTDSAEKLTPIESLSGVKIISAGKHISLFVDTSGISYSCGISPLHGHATLDNIIKPTKIPAFTDIKITDISAGFAHCAAVAEDGGLFTWGEGINFQLGHGVKNNEKVPRKVKALEFTKVIQVSCTRSDKKAHTGCVDSEGRAFTWGAGQKGKLGHSKDRLHPDTADLPLPKQIEFFSTQKVREIFCAGLHSAILTEDGKLYTFGCGSDGRLGHPECFGHRYLYKEPVPRLIDAFSTSRVIAVATSYYHMLALTE